MMQAARTSSVQPRGRDMPQHILHRAALLWLALLIPLWAADPVLPDLSNRKPRSDWVNVKTVVGIPQAMGDGIADDTAALQAAIDLLNASKPLPAGYPGTVRPYTVFLPAGTYRITKTLQLKDSNGCAIVGVGGASVISWDGVTSADYRENTMLISDGGRHNTYSGLTWDGNGRAVNGFVHASNPNFESQNRHEFETFRNFKANGLRFGSYGNNTASSEQEIQNCIFIRCDPLGSDPQGAGIYVQDANYYNYAIENCDFYDNRAGVIFTYFAQGYIRRCHFERSVAFDISAGEPSFPTSVRHCTSIGSKRFFQHSRNSKYVIQNCVIEGWTALDGAMYLDGPYANAVFDCLFLNPPSAFPAINDPDGGKILAGNVSAGTSSIAVNSPTAVSRTRPADALNSSTLSHRQLSLPAEGTVYDFFAVYGTDGTKRNTANVQALINMAKQAGNGAIAYFPAGSYSLTDTVVVSGSNYTVEGSAENTRFNWDASAAKYAGPMLRVESPQNITLKKLWLYGAGIKGDETYADLQYTMIKQVNTGAATSSVFYDQITGQSGSKLLAPYPSYFEGLHLVGLTAGDHVHIGRLGIPFRATNCGRATILGEFMDTQPLVIDGTETVRDGFIGVLNGNSANIQVRDNQNFVFGDYYTEEADNGIYLQGAAGNPTGTVVIGCAKQDLRGTTVLKDVIFNVDNYQGLACYAFPFINVDENSRTYGVRQRGDRPVDLVLVGARGDLTWDLGAGATKIVYPGAGGTQLSAIFDAFHRLGVFDRANHPTLDVGTEVALPGLSPAGGIFYGPVNVQVRCATANAQLTYTVDGSEPASGSTPVPASGLLTLSATAKLRVAAFKTGLASSQATGSYTIPQINTGESIWPDSKIPTKKNNEGAAGSELGIRFLSSVDGTISKLRVYRVAGESGLHGVSLYQVDNLTGGDLGSPLFGPYQVDISGPEGWVTLDIPSQRILKNTDYIFVVTVGTDAKHLYPTTQFDNDTKNAGNNGRNLYRPASNGHPGGYDTTYFRDVVFYPDATFEGPTSASKPGKPAKPTVGDNNTVAPLLSGTVGASEIVRIELHSSFNGNAVTKVVGSTQADANGAWTFRISGQRTGTFTAYISSKNSAGVSPLSDGVSVTIGTAAVATALAQIEITHNNQGVGQGATDVIAATEAVTATYTIKNVGTAALQLGTVATRAAVNATVTIATAPAASLAAGQSTTLALAVSPTVIGNWQFGVSIPTNDQDQNPTGWSVKGYGASVPGGGTTGSGTTGTGTTGTGTTGTGTTGTGTTGTGTGTTGGTTAAGGDGGGGGGGCGTGSGLAILALGLMAFRGRRRLVA